MDENNFYFLFFIFAGMVWGSLLSWFTRMNCEAELEEQRAKIAELITRLESQALWSPALVRAEVMAFLQANIRVVHEEDIK